MSSGYGSLPRRYNRAKRAAIVAASASVLTGTTIALPSATFANEIADSPPIVNVGLTENTADSPDAAVPLPEVEVDTGEPVLAPVSGALNLSAPIHAGSEAADSAVLPTDTVSSESGATAPLTSESPTPWWVIDGPLAAEPQPVAAPVVTAPVVTAPVVTEPVATNPAPTAPVAPEPVVAAQPVVTDPVVTEPVADQPVEADPVVTELVLTGPISTEPTAAEPAVAGPVLTELILTAPVVTEPMADVESAPAVSTAQPSVVEPALSSWADFDALRPSTLRSAPATAVPAAAKPAAGLAPATPAASDTITSVRSARADRQADRQADGQADRRADRQADRVAAVRAAEVLGTEKSVRQPARGGLGLVAPLTDVGPRGVDTVDLAARNAPDSAMGDWNLMPEVLFAVGPLFLAGAAVAAHGRRNAQAAAGHVGVVQRRRHANTP